MKSYHKHRQAAWHDWVLDYLYNIAPIALTLLICGYQSSWGKQFSVWSIIIATVITLLLAAIKTHLQHRKNIGLQEYLNQLEGENLKLSEKLDAHVFQFECLLSSAIKDSGEKMLNLVSTDRITIYVHSIDEDGKGFFSRVARHSPNPEYKNSGRTQYPDNEGCIGIAWQHGSCFEENAFNGKGKNYSRSDLEKYNLTHEKVKGLSMSSAYLAAVRLPNSMKDDPIAVVVVESTKSNRFTQEQINEWVKLRQWFFIEIIKSLGDNIPKPLTAEKAGF